MCLGGLAQKIVEYQLNNKRHAGKIENENIIRIDNIASPFV